MFAFGADRQRKASLIHFVVVSACCTVHRARTNAQMHSLNYAKRVHDRARTHTHTPTHAGQDMEADKSDWCGRGKCLLSLYIIGLIQLIITITQLFFSFKMWRDRRLFYCSGGVRVHSNCAPRQSPLGYCWPVGFGVLFVLLIVSRVFARDAFCVCERVRVRVCMFCFA